jgi:O-antigen/teichoic acid export membrane protein
VHSASKTHREVPAAQLSGEPPTGVLPARVERREGARGAIVFMASRIVLIVCGFATYAVVARKLTTAEFGVYGVVGAVINVMNTVVGTGTSQAISRLVSRHEEAAATLLRRGLRWSWLVTAVTAAGLIMTAPLIASSLNDAELTHFLRLVAFVPGLYTLMAAYSGFLNGMRALSRQGFVNMSLSVARLALIGLAALLGYGLVGTLSGLVAAAVTAVLAARWLARIPAGQADVELRTTIFLRMLISFVGVSLMLQLLLANDLLLIKKLAPAASANERAGIYTAAQSIARIPYYFLIGISQMVYPRLSARVAGRDIDAARRTSSLVLSGMAVVLCGALAIVLPLTRDVIRIVYPERYGEGAATLGWLLAGSAALSLVEASLTMLSGAGGPRRSVLVLSAAVAIQIVLGLLLIPHHGVIGAAQATLLAALVALVVAAALLNRLVGTALLGRLVGTAVLPLAAVALASLFWAGLRMPPICTLLFIAVAYLVYLGSVYWLNRGPLRQLLAPGGLDATPLHDGCDG